MTPRSILSIVLLLFFLVSCGGGGGDSSSKPATRKVGHITGVVFDAAISNSTVSAYEFKNGRVGKLLASTKTNQKGQYSLEIQSGPMPLYIESQGGGYLDPYSGKIVEKSSTGGLLTLITYINYSEGNNHDAMITPLTNFGAGLTEYLIRSNGVDPSVAIDNTNTQLLNIYGFNVFTTKPLDLTSEGSSGGISEGHEYGALLTAYSSYAYEKLNESQLKEETVYTSYNLSDIQYQDIRADGTLNGKITDKNGFVKKISFGIQPISVRIYTNHLAQHMLRVVNDPKINKSGVSADQFSDFSERLNKPESDIFTGASDYPINEDAPVVTQSCRDEGEACLNNILSLKDNIYFNVADYIGIKTIDPIFEYEDSDGQWQEISYCNYNEERCQFDSSFVIGQQAWAAFVKVDTALLDLFDAKKARVRFEVSDVFDLEDRDQSIEFKWDNVGPSINIDEEKSPLVYNPNADNSLYKLVGTVKNNISLLSSLRLTIGGDDPKTLPCDKSLIEPGVCNFSQAIDDVDFKDKGSLILKVEAEDENHNKKPSIHVVYTDTGIPTYLPSFSDTKIKFINYSTGTAQEEEGYLAEDSFTHDGEKKALKIDFKYAKNGLSAIPDSESVNFENFNVKILKDNGIPYIQFKVGDTLTENTGSSAEKLTLKVEYKIKGNLANTISTKDNPHVIPHQQIDVENIEFGKVRDLIYYIPFTRDIFGPKFEDATKGDTQSIEVTVSNKSGNSSDVYKYAFKSTFELPVVKVMAPFLDAEASLFRFNEKGTYEHVASCDLKPEKLRAGADERALDLASCSMSTPYVGEVHKISLSGDSVEFHQWSINKETTVNLNPDKNYTNYPITGYVYVNGSKDIYLSELSVFQSGFFDSLWAGDDKVNVQERANDILNKVNDIFLKGKSFFNFNPITTSYATNEDLDKLGKAAVVHTLSNSYQHRFIVEALGKMSKDQGIDSTVLAKAFYADFASGTIDGKDSADAQIKYGNKDLTPETYRTVLAQFYYDFVRNNFENIPDYVVMRYANTLSTANPLLGDKALFGDDHGASIDKNPPEVTVVIGNEDNFYNPDSKNPNPKSWYIKDKISVVVTISDPSGISDSPAPKFEFLWGDDASEATNPLESIVLKDVESTAYKKSYEFEFNSVSEDYPTIKRMDMLVSVSDTVGNSYDDSTPHITSFIVDNSPPSYTHTNQNVADEGEDADVDHEKTYISLAVGKDQQKLSFAILDIVGEKEGKRQVKFTQLPKSLGVSKTIEYSEMITDGNEFSIVLCGKACADGETNRHYLEDGKWELQIASEDKLGNVISFGDPAVQKFYVYIDSTAPHVESNTVENPDVIGANKNWNVTSFITYGNETHRSEPGPISMKLSSQNFGRHELGTCDVKSPDEIACLIVKEGSTLVELNPEKLTHGEILKFDISAKDSAFPANEGQGKRFFKVDKEGPVVTLENPAVVAEPSGGQDLTPDVMPIVGRNFSVHILKITDDSELGEISLWQKLDNGDLKKIIEEKSADNKTFYVSDTDSAKIEINEGNNRINLVVRAKDEHGFSSDTAVPVFIYDIQGPTITLKNYQKDKYYVPGYSFGFNIKDLNDDSIDKESIKYWASESDISGDGVSIGIEESIKTQFYKNFNLRIEAQDIRGNLSTENFKIKVDSQPPTGNLIIHQGGNELKPGTVVSKAGPLSLTLKDVSSASGVSDITALVKRSGESEGSSFRFHQNVGSTSWASTLDLTTDGDYSIDIKMYNSAITDQDDGNVPGTIQVNISVKRGGHELTLVAPEDFANHKAGKSLTVEFSTDDTSGLKKLECWIREDWKSDEAPEDTIAPYVSYEGINSPICNFSNFTEDLPKDLSKNLVLITRTEGDNEAKVTQKFSFKMIDVTAPVILDREIKLLTENVFFDVTAEVKKLTLGIKVEDGLSGIDKAKTPTLRTYNNHGGLVPTGDPAYDGDNKVTYFFTQDYVNIINSASPTQTVKLDGVKDNVGNIIAGENSNITLIVPGVDPQVKIDDLADEQWIPEGTIKFNYRTKLGEESGLYDVVVSLNDTELSLKKEGTSNGTFTKFVKCNDGDEWLCSSFKAKIPELDSANRLNLKVTVFDYWENAGSNGENGITLNIDKDKPVIAAEPTSITRVGNDVLIRFDIQDEKSQIAKVRYSSNIGNENVVVEKTSDSDRYLVMEIPFDKLDNKSDILVNITATNKVGLQATGKVKVVLTKPQVALTLPKTKLVRDRLLLDKDAQPFTLNATNPGSKVQAVSYTISLALEDDLENIIASKTGGINGTDTTVNSLLNLASSEQGLYRLTLSVIDSMGREISSFYLNENNEQKLEYAGVIIDRYPPEISSIQTNVERVALDSEGRYKFIVKANISDVHLDHDLVGATLNRDGTSFTPVEKIVEPDTDQYTFVFRVLPGEYDLTITATDFADRVTTTPNLNVDIKAFDVPELTLTADGKTDITLVGVEGEDAIKRATLAFDFSEDIFDFDISDIKLASPISGEVGLVSDLTMDSDSRRKWTANYTITSGVDDVITIKVNDGSFVNDIGIAGLGEQIVINIEGSAPVASNVEIKLAEETTSPTVGDELTGAYEYSDVDGDKKDTSASIYQWYADGEAIDKATDLTYRLTILDHDKKIRFSVTPVALTGTQKQGKESFSKDTEAVLELVGEPLVFGGNVKITMDESFSRAVEGGNGGTITYSSSLESVATVDSQGLVTMVGVGDTVITATEEQGGDFFAQKASYKLKVTTGTGTPLVLDTSDVSKTMDEGLTREATEGNGGTITYSSSLESVATVDSQGLVTMVGVGDTVITATEAATANYDEQAALYNLKVTTGTGTPLVLDTSDVSKTMDEGLTREATEGNGGTITYSSSLESVATVDSQGLVTMVGVGDTVITATEAATANYDEQAALYNLKVTTGTGTPLVLDTSDVSKTMDEGLTREATEGNGGTITYSSSLESVATVDSQGLVTMVGVGDTVITATEAATANYDEQAALYNLKVTTGTGTPLVLDTSDVSKTMDEGLTREATEGNGGTITYSSSLESVATVDSQGLVTMVGVGDTVITATEAATANYDEQAALYNLKVTTGTGTPLVLDTSDVSKTMDEGLTREATEGNGGTITYSSSLESVATVDSQGLVTMVGVGDTVITATEAATANYDEQAALYNLKVTTGTGTPLVLDTSDVSKTMDEGLTREATEGNGGTITYSSSLESVATVDSQGLVTMVGVGDTVITATEAATANYDEQAALYNLKVTTGTGTPLVLDTSDVSKTMDEGLTREATEGNGGTITYSSSLESVATVDSQGLVTMVGVGDTVITATEAATANYDEQAALYNLKVTTGTGTPLVLDTSDVSKTMDEGLTREATEGNGGTITYSSSLESVATVDSQGLVTMVGVGDTVITATEAATANYDEQAALYNLKVTTGTGTPLVLDTSDVSKTMDEGLTREATEGNGGTITYSSSLESVATVDSQGLVTMVGVGDTVITATEAATANYDEQAALYNLKVTTGTGTPLVLDTSDVSKTMDEGLTREATEGNGGTITYSSSLESVATVDSQGLVTMVGVGDTVITATEAATANYDEQAALYNLKVTTGTGTPLVLDTSDVSKTMDEGLTREATEGNGGTITYSSSLESVATVDSQGLVTMVGVGDTVITATEAATANYDEQAALYNLKVTTGTGTPLVLDTSDVSKTMDEGLTREATEGNGGTITYSSSLESVATVDSQGLVTMVGVGDTVITATEAATANYDEQAALYNLKVTTGTGTPLVLDTSDVSKTMDEGLTREATEGNGGTITYSSSLESVATVDSQGLVTMVGVGDTVIMATEAATANYDEQAALYNLKVTTGTGTPLVLDTSDVSKTMDEGLTREATEGNGGTITYSSSLESVATVDSQGLVTMVGVGDTVITATEAATANYDEQAALYNLKVTTGTGTPLVLDTSDVSKTMDEGLTREATEGNGGTITYSSSLESVATVDSQGLVTMVGVGDTVITATEAATANYDEQAALYNLKVTTGTGTPLVLDTSDVSKTMDEGLTREATEGNGGTITYSSSLESVATVDSQGLVTMVGVGDTVITATEAATANYDEQAALYNLKVTTGTGTPLVLDTSDVSKTMDEGLTREATEGNGGTITYSSSLESVATVDSQGLVTMVGVGDTVITATEAATANYDEQAALYNLKVTTGTGTPLVLDTSDVSKTMDEGLTREATEGNGGTITYSSSLESVATVDSQGLVTMVGVGDTVITATEAATANYDEQAALYNLKVTTGTGTPLVLDTSDVSKTMDEGLTREATEGNGGTITYSSSLESVATVDSQGLVTMVGVGDTVITATEAATANYDEQAALYNLKVTTGTGTPLVLDTSDVSKTMDEGLTREATEGNGGTITYSSSLESVATVDSQGLVTMVGVGDTVITATEAATANYDEQAALYNLKVTTGTGTPLVLDTSDVSKTMDEGLTREATEGNGGTITYSSSLESVATVDSQGLVTMVGVGDTVITATEAATANYDEQAALYNLKVTTGTGTPLVLDTSDVSKTMDEGLTREATEGNGGTITYSSSLESVATVDSQGLVTMVGVGDTVIMATEAATANYDEQAALYNLKVTTGTGTPLVLDTSDVSKTMDEGLTREATEGNGGTITYSSSLESVATVDSQGLVTMVGVGDTVITATEAATANYDEQAALYNLKVTTGTGTPLVLDTSDVSKTMDEGLTREATEGNGGTITYSSSLESVATVDSQGLVTMVGVGDTVITATEAATANYDEQAALYNLKVTTGTGTPLVLDTSDVSKTMDEGLTREATEGNGGTITYSSSLESVATVDSQGLVTMVGVGDTVITATEAATANYDEQAALYNLKVTTGTGTPLVLDTSDVSKTMDEGLTREATEGNGGTITYSSSLESVATVDSQGLVTMVGVGDTVITATEAATANYDEQAALYNLKVTTGTGTPLVLDTSDVSKTMDEGLTREATEGNGGTITYSSSLESVATVDSQGLVTMVGVGDTVITATEAATANYDEQAALYNLKVTTGTGTPLVLDTSDVSKTMDEGLTREATEGNGGTITYSSSLESVATVDSQGLVTMVGVGDTVITATEAATANYDEQAALYNLKVTTGTGTPLVLDTSDVSKTMDEGLTREATEGNGGTITYSSSLESVATVDSQGLVTMVGVGDTVITATEAATANYDEQAALYNLKVTTGTGTPLVLDTSDVSKTMDEGLTREATEGNGGTITYSSSLESVATVDSQGLVTMVGVGDTVITATEAATANYDEQAALYNLKVTTGTGTPLVLDTSDVSKTMDEGLTREATEGNGGTITYSSSLESVATVDSQGLVTMVGVGDTVIMATEAATANYDEQAALYNLKVTTGTGTPLVLDTSDVSKTMDEGLTREATEGNGGTITYSSSLESVATVDSQGLVTMVGVGDTVITATEAATANYDEQAALYNLKVTTGTGTPLVLDTSDVSKTMDEGLTREATEGNGGTITYSSSLESVATVDSQGLVTMVGVGDTVITATEAATANYDEQAALYNLKVTTGTGTPLVLDTSDVSKTMDEGLTREATEGNGGTITYSSSLESVATVDSQGLVTMVGVGDTVITATEAATANYDEQAALYNLKVTTGTGTPLVLDTSDVSKTMDEGLTREATEGNGGTITYSSSLESVATVDSQGLVTMVGVGDTVITATEAATANYDEQAALYNLKVTTGTGTPLVLDTSDVSKTMDEGLTREATEGNGGTITYSSSLESVATVDSQGLVTMVGVGDTVITATEAATANYDEQAALYNLKVTTGTGTPLVLDTSDVSKTMDEGLTREATEGNGGTITYSSSLESVATVDSQGLVTMVGVGDTVITATEAATANYDEQAALYNLKVTTGTGTPLVLDTSDVSKTMDEGLTREATEGNGGTITYSSSLESVATVDSQGLVTMVGVGDTVITATEAATANYDEQAALYNLKVTTGTGTPLVLDTSDVSKTMDEGLTREATEGNGGTITYSSSLESVATVDSQGLVTMVGVGDTVITATEAATANYDEQAALYNLKVTTGTGTPLVLDTSDVSKTMDEGLTREATEGNGGTITYSSSLESVATVDSQGLVTMVGVGDTVITATEAATANYDEQAALYNLKVTTGTGTPLVLDTSDVSKTMDEGLTREATEGNGGTITYSSSLESVATVDSQGLVTMVGVGDTVIIATEAATANYEQQAALYNLKVTTGTGTPLVLDTSDVSKTMDEGLTREATEGNGGTITYSSSLESVATVDSQGLVTMVGVGDTVITATEAATANYDEQAALYNLKVTTGTGTPLVLDTSDVSKTMDEGLTREATEGNGGTITYSSSLESVATVDSQGLVTMVGVGDTVITATEAATANYDEQAALYNLKVTTGTGTPLVLDTSDVSKTMDEGLTREATEGNGGTITYSSSLESVATVDSQGLVTMVGVGDTVITATEAATANYDEQAALYNLKVTTGTGTPLVLDTSDVSKTMDEGLTREATEGNGGTITYSSSLESVATVDSQGLVTMVGVGDTVITATEAATANYDEQAALYNLKVTTGTGTPLVLDTSDVSKTMDEGLTREATEGNGGTITYSSSLESVATVDSQGLVTMVGVGDTVITATEAATANYDEQAALYNLKVTTGTGTPLVLDTSDVSKTMDEGLTREATEGNGGTITYSSSLESVATVDSQGLVTMVGVGDTVITATEAATANYDEQAALYNLKVTTGTGTPLVLDTSDVSKTMDEGLTREATEGNGGTITYSSSLESVATVDSQGLVTMVGVGDTVITATEAATANYDEQAALYNLKVTTGTGTPLVLDTSDVSKTMDEGLTREATEGNGGTITYSSSLESVATVDSQGLVTMVGVGDTVITATEAATANYDEQAALYNLKVTTGTGTPLVLDTSDVSKTMDEGLTREATEGNGGTITYSSSLESVATVDSQGLVTMVGVGDTVITATEAATANYDEQAALYNLKVTTGTGTPLVLDTSDVSKTMDEGLTREATEGNGGTITYSSSLESVATVDSQGLVTMVGVGDTVITATEAATANYDEQAALYNLKVTTGS
ncbi:Ig-like domain-containing protein [Moritella sp. 5]|uniref:Ig-like domain-containing protein n=1 Tax=Moritella sp. 5 TaxID=2746231 RepID=UPI001BADD683|nr:Ig-like domain-containing protein [Moritella sp. 5]QUM80144.1 Ig-like domain-containing protein [Moritella sp. 5]